MIGRTRISKLLERTFPRLCSPFSSEKAKSILSQNAQRAAWASTIVKKICKAKGSDIITDSSLREQLLSLQHPDGISNLERSQKVTDPNHLIFDDGPRSDILNIFTDGLILPEAVFNQQRIQRAKQFSSGDGQKMRKFVFCPNVLVTKEMFYILRQYAQNLLIYGGFGISKTISLILFHYLSSIINRFVYQSFSDKTQKQELKLLTGNKLIIDVPKIFYWSLNLTDEQSDLKSLIIAQATELSKNQIEQLLEMKNFSEFVSSLRRKYRDKDITIRIVIDQINMLASLFRKCNNFYTTAEKDSLEMQQMDKLLKSGKLLRTRMKAFQYLGRTTFYNSSMNIQQDLLKNQNVLYLKGALDISKSHEPINTFNIPYFQNMEHKWGCNDFSHYFWFQIEKRLKARKLITQDQLCQIKSLFYTHVENTKWPKYLRFVNIRRMFKNQQLQIKQIFNNFEKNTNLSESMALLPELLEQSSISDFKENLTKFFNKNQSQQDKIKKIKLFSIFYNWADNREDKDSIFEVQVSALSNVLKPSQIIKHLGSELANKQMVSLQLKPQSIKVVFSWTPNEFMEISRDILFPIALKYPPFNDKMAEIMLQKVSALGSLLVGALNGVLQIPQTVSIFYYKNPLKDYPNQMMMFSTTASTSFLQFNKKDKNIPDHLRKMLDEAYNNPNQFIFGYPIIQKKGSKNKELTEVAGTNSQCIDNAFIKYNQKDKIFQIFTFDVTIAVNLGDKPENAEKFLDQVILFTKNYSCKSTDSEAIQQIVKNQNYRIIHTILCSQKIQPVYKVQKVNGKIIWEIKTAYFDTLVLAHPDSNNLEFQLALQCYKEQKQLLQIKNRS